MYNVKDKDIKAYLLFKQSNSTYLYLTISEAVKLLLNH